MGFLKRRKRMFKKSQKAKRTTPEGVVKDMVEGYLQQRLKLIPASKASEVTYENNGWYYMPVQNGMGVSGIPDFLGHYKGFFFAIETKKNATEKPTPRQDDQLHAIDRTGAVSYVVGDEDKMIEFCNEIEDI
jgi:hypothetical protein